MANRDLGELTENFEEEVEALKNAKMKLFGITMTPTTIGAAFAIVSTVVGGLYASFQVYDDYMGMKEIVENIDVGTIETRNQQIEASLANVNKEISIQLASIQKQLDDAEKRNRENKVDTNQQIGYLEDQTRRVEKLVRDTEASIRQTIQNAEERFDNKRDALQNQYDTKASQLRESNDSRINDLESKMERDMQALETNITTKLQRALDNPLAN